MKQTTLYYCVLSLVLIIVVSMSALAQKHQTTPSAQGKKSAFQLALPGYSYHFPEDHASHPAFKTEWWYYTGHLQSVNPTDKKPQKNRKLGYELTFFRVGQQAQTQTNKQSSFWNADTYYMAHLAITDETGKRFMHTQRFNRNTPYRAGAKSDTYRVWNEHWRVVRNADGKHYLHASHGGQTPDGFGLDLILNEGKAPVIHGQQGVSQKADCHGCASHYYSLTRMPTQGTIQLGTTTYQVTGTSWMDHEFGSNQLQANQTGWDWFSLQLSNGYELMLYQMRLSDGGIDPNSSGTWVKPDGTSQHIALNTVVLKPKEQWKSPHTQGIYPSGWRIVDKAHQLDVTITPVLNDQELAPEQAAYGVAYWEGRCTINGTHLGEPVSGNAYVELTGYDKPFEQTL